MEGVFVIGFELSDIESTIRQHLLDLMSDGNYNTWTDKSIHEIIDME